MHLYIIIVVYTHKIRVNCVSVYTNYKRVFMNQNIGV